MSGDTVFCTNCGARIEDKHRFCTECGTPLRVTEPAQAPPPPPPPEPEEEEGLLQGLRTRIKGVGDKASNVSEITKSAVAPEKASAAVRNMLSVMTKVASDVKRDLPQDMVKAVDLTAEINLIAFTIGVSIDLEQLKIKGATALPVE
jgi:hypothetical protein